MTGRAAKPYAAITTLRATTPLAAPAPTWASAGPGPPAAWLVPAPPNLDCAGSRDVLLRSIAEHEPDLREHSLLVAALALRVAAVLGLDAASREGVARAAELHDVGKLAIPGTVLRKPGPLDPAEVELMRRHSEIGEAIVRAAPALGRAAAVVRASHERWDGGGYPDGLAGETIPLGARIVAVCDAYSAMRQARPYGDVLTDVEARAELVRCAGTQFDPSVVEAFCRGR